MSAPMNQAITSFREAVKAKMGELNRELTVDELQALAESKCAYASTKPKRQRNNPTVEAQEKVLTLLGHWRNGILSDLELAAHITVVMVNKQQKEELDHE